jgi:metal-responsive CopG/Arc/MetJ family transcriptional regulator
MNAVKINVNLSPELYDALAREITPRKRSMFIREAIVRSLQEKRNMRLADEYRDAAQEIRIMNTDLEGTLADGID